MADLKMLAAIIEDGRTAEVVACMEALLDAGFTPEQIVGEGVMPGLQEVGRKFGAQEIFLPEMLLAARTANLGNEYMRTRMNYVNPIGRHAVLLGTVAGDLHDIGKNLVGMAMRGIGVEVIDLGVDVPVSAFVKVVESNPNICFVGLSAILTTTLPAMRDTIAALRKSKAADRIKIMVGGAPVTAVLAEKMEADIYTETAFEAAQTVQKLLKTME